MRRKRVASLDRNKGSKPKRTASALRPFPYLTVYGIQELKDETVKQRIPIDMESYEKHHALFMSSSISVQQLSAYRSILKSQQVAWQTWSTTLSSFKFTIAGALGGALVPVAMSWLRHTPLWSLSLAWVLEIPIIGLVFWIIWAPAHIVIKSERATFLIEVLDNAIQTRTQTDVWTGVAATVECSGNGATAR